jgi:hypothetical protein
MQNIVADVLDELAADFKAASREPTTGATESQILGSLSRTFVKRAALLREAAAAAADAEERRQAAEQAAAQRTAAEQAAAGDTPPTPEPLFDPAEHGVNEVNDHLRDASPEERARVLEVEKQDRPDVPASKKQRAGILGGPFGDQF